MIFLFCRMFCNRWCLNTIWLLFFIFVFSDNPKVFSTFSIWWIKTSCRALKVYCPPRLILGRKCPPRQCCECWLRESRWSLRDQNAQIAERSATLSERLGFLIDDSQSIALLDQLWQDADGDLDWCVVTDRQSHGAEEWSDLVFW